MSIVTNIGIAGVELSESDLKVTAKSSGLPILVIHENTVRSNIKFSHIIENILPGGHWATVLTHEGELDLDLVYNLNEPFSLNSLGLFLLSLADRPNIEEIVILFFDLGTNERWIHQHSIDDIERVLNEFYRNGGPAATVIHKFKRIDT